jgi:hypothetical protein
VLRCQLHAIVAAIARRYRSRHVDCYLPSSGFRGDSPGMDYTRHPRWAQTYNSSRQRETGTAALSADMGRRMNPIRAGEPMSITMCWIGLAQGFTESDRAVLLEEDVRWERGYHTRGVSRACWASLWKQRYPKREPSVQHVEGSLKAPRRAAASVPHSQRARKSQGLRGTSVSDNIPTRFLPHRSIHD